MSAPPPKLAERFIPFARRDVVAMAAGRLGDDADGFRSFAEILTSFLHVEYQVTLERLKEAYEPFAQDRDTRAMVRQEPFDADVAQGRLVEELTRLLVDANFEPITDEELGDAFDAESLMKIRVSVDFDEFDTVLFYRRGVTNRTETVTGWGGLRTREIDFTSYDRVVVYVRFAERPDLVDDERQELPYEPGSTLVKLFQNVPRADLEMLFPNTEVRMRTIDKLIIGVPAAISGVIVVTTKLLGSILLVGLLMGTWLGLRDDPVEIDQGALVALGVGLATLVGFAAKQWTKFKNRKILFMKRLSENLYFRNLDNDSGVFFRLLDAAEEEEAKEMLLAYGALLAGGPMTEGELDRDVEDWLERAHDCTLDFEISDALGDLVRLDLVERDGQRYRAVPLSEARRRLDERWDRVFAY